MDLADQPRDLLYEEIDRLRARNAELEAEVRRGAHGAPVPTVETPPDAAQRALAQRLEKLAHLDRMKENFLSLLSHELRTPISVILGYASMLEDQFESAVSPEMRDYLHHIMQESDKLLALVNNVLDMNRLMTGEMTVDYREVALPEIAQNVVEQFRPIAERKGVRLENLVPESFPTVCSDEQRLGQVLRNLLDNAIRFTPEGGSVRVRVTDIGGRLRCEVEDTGVGIDEEDLAKLFQVFGQLDSSATRMSGGMGLGLALVRELVTLLGGAVGVKSTRGVGSTFWFEIPFERDLEPNPTVEIRRQVKG